MLIKEIPILEGKIFVGKGKKKKSTFGAIWNENLLKQAMLIMLSIIVTLLILPDIITTVPRLTIGDTANQDINARRDILVEDVAATRKNKNEILMHSPLVFDFDVALESRVESRYHKVFEILRKAKSSSTNRPEKTETASGIRAVPLNQNGPTAVSMEFSDRNPAFLDAQKFRENVSTKLESIFENELLPKTIDLLLRIPVDQETEMQGRKIIREIMKPGIVVSKAFFAEIGKRAVILHNIPSGEETNFEKLSSIRSLDEARKELNRLITKNFTRTKKEFVRAYQFLASRFIQPNITFDRKETERRKEILISRIKPVFFQIKKGETIIRQGEKVEPEQYMGLMAMYQHGNGRKRIITLAGVFLLSMMMIWIVTFVAMHHVKSFPNRTRDFFTLFCVLSFFLVSIRLYDFMAGALDRSFPFVQSEGVLYSFPLTGAVILISIIFNVETALVASLLLCLLTGIILGNNFALFFFFLIGCFVAARGVSVCRDRITPIRTGFLVGILNMGVAGVLTLMGEKLNMGIAGANLSFAFMGGLLAGVIASGLTPMIEMLFHYTTDIKLLELANLDHPLLRELMIQAPGTYHHSIIVGNMVEAAARTINANSLLARVAAYYHDIGKMKKPSYFIENEKEGENRHSKLAPSMSSLILISHVKEGVELAGKYNIGKPITDIIKQHHGTSLISFFYQKAAKLREKTDVNRKSDLPPVNIDEYRYPGPKPQTREAGLVMLADCVEAASRTLTEPSPSKIQGLVHRLINNIFIDGELDECELTLKDLHQIAQQFNKILNGIYHRRIEYPEREENDGSTKERSNGNSNQRSSRPERDQRKGDKEKGKENIKRLGISRG